MAEMNALNVSADRLSRSIASRQRDEAALCPRIDGMHLFDAQSATNLMLYQSSNGRSKAGEENR